MRHRHAHKHGLQTHSPPLCAKAAVSIPSMSSSWAAAESLLIRPDLDQVAFFKTSFRCWPQNASHWSLKMHFLTLVDAVSCQENCLCVSVYSAIHTELLLSGGLRSLCGFFMCERRNQWLWGLVRRVAAQSRMKTFLSRELVLFQANSLFFNTVDSCKAQLAMVWRERCDQWSHCY